MANKRSIDVAEYSTDEQPVPDEFNPQREFETRVVSISVTYDEGGANFLSGTNSPRGYYLHVSVETIRQEPGRHYAMRCFELFNSGLKAFIIGATRFNVNTLRKCADAALDSDICARVLHRVLTSKDLHVSDPQALAILARAPKE